VSYNEKKKKWTVQRKHDKKQVYNGSYKDEITAAHASDTLARELMANGENDHKLNFPEDDTEVHPETQNSKRKRPVDFNN